MRKWNGAAILVLLFVAVAFSVPAGAEDEDPPSRVARISFLKGDVSFQPAGGNEWAEAKLNRPLTTSDRLWTEAGGRAELSIGTAALRVGPESSFSFLNLDDNTTQVQLTQGAINVRLRNLEERENFEIDTPNAAVTLLRAGDYRVDVYPDSTTVTVRQGYAQVDGSGQAFSVRAAQLARIYESNYTVAAAPTADDFDAWCRDREQRYERAAASRYVSQDMIGYEDLEDYGYWQAVPTYGTVWMPRAMPVGWAPYRFGHWAWIGPWGWTWIDDAPWGFAPFHYGRWVFTPAGWAWAPGPIVRRPVYAPALVAFFGGAGWQFGGGPVFGWFPLGWRDVYYPGYRCSRRYYTNVNITNIIVHRTYIDNHYDAWARHDMQHADYHNRHVAGGITTASPDVFLHGRPVQHAILKLPPREVSKADISPVAPVAPDRRSLIGAADTAHARPPMPVMDRNVKTRILPPAPPDSFDERRQALADNPGRPAPVIRPGGSDAARTSGRQPVTKTPGSIASDEAAVHPRAKHVEKQVEKQVEKHPDVQPPSRRVASDDSVDRRPRQPEVRPPARPRVDAEQGFRPGDPPKHVTPSEPRINEKPATQRPADVPSQRHVEPPAKRVDPAPQKRTDPPVGYARPAAPEMERRSARVADRPAPRPPQVRSEARVQPRSQAEPDRH